MNLQMDEKDFGGGKSHVVKNLPLISWNVITLSIVCGSLCFVPFFISFAVYALNNPDLEPNCYVLEG